MPEIAHGIHVIHCLSSPLSSIYYLGILWAYMPPGRFVQSWEKTQLMKVILKKRN